MTDQQTIEAETTVDADAGDPVDEPAAEPGAGAGEPVGDPVEEPAAEPGAEAGAGEPVDDPVTRVLANGSIRSVFQPIVELSSQKVLGFEALTRFHDEPGLSPQTWFAAASAAGLRVPAEIAAARAALKVFDLLPADCFVALNVSAHTAASDEFLNVISVVPASRVVLDITESEAVDELAAVAEAIDALRALGVRIALDDAGSGFVSLRHLLGVNADILKIDTAITRGIDTDPVNQALACSLKSLAERAGAVSLAEGVETPAELAMLRSLGIEAGQGYLFGRPEPISAQS